MKVCSRCQVEKPATPEHYYRAPDGRLGLKAECKTCADTRRTAARQRERAGQPSAPRRNGVPTLPAAPLRALIERDNRERPRSALAADARVSVRLIRRVMNEAENVSVTTADRLCTALGTHIRIVYDEAA